MSQYEEEMNNDERLDKALDKLMDYVFGAPNQKQMDYNFMVSSVLRDEGEYHMADLYFQDFWTYFERWHNQDMRERGVSFEQD